VVVGLMDAEEVGLVGSKHFVAALGAPGGLAVGDGGPPLTLGAIKAVINLDASSVRASDAQSTPQRLAHTDLPLFSWRVIVSSEESTLTAAANAVLASHQVMGLPVTAGGAVALQGSLRSDVAWFQKAGVPFVWPAAGYPEYHTEADTLATVDPADLAGLADAAVELTARIATLPIGRIPQNFR
jgi:Zn-dependent M28 family amino/carboxypeptidase